MLHEATTMADSPIASAPLPPTDIPPRQSPTTAKAEAVGKVDAVLCPINYPKLRPGEDRHIKLKEEFGPVLGATIVHARTSDQTRTTTLITGNLTLANGLGVSRYFPTSHPLVGRERYEWKDRGDGILYGMLTPEALEYERTANE
jgi:hypothetical protein